NSCQQLGCERPVDCGGAGRVCDPMQSPPACVEGCFSSADCSAGERCKDAPPPATGSYDRAQCRSFSDLPVDNDTQIGTCCNPGCLDRNLQCGLNEWCCGEPGSPYADPATCLTKTATGGPQAEPGECFEMISNTSGAGRTQWCAACTNEGFSGQSAAASCSAPLRGMVPGPDGTPGWTPGLNVDPAFNGGQPFREIEFCHAVADGLGFCATTCNPNAEDNGCPGRQGCGPVFAPCCQDSDCGGLTCAGAACDAATPIAGRCQCGQNGVQSDACPSMYQLVDTPVPFPRCVESGDARDMFCLTAYNCRPPQISELPGIPGEFNYPDACLAP
ncbi:MAG: hypothetical protein AAFN74_19660, partial [Myxococcota bacterium]